MASTIVNGVDDARNNIHRVRSHAEQAGRNPDKLGFQAQLSGAPRQSDSTVKEFYANSSSSVTAAGVAAEAGFDWITVNVTGLFLAGARSVDAMIEGLAVIYDDIRNEIGLDR